MDASTATDCSSQQLAGFYMDMDLVVQCRKRVLIGFFMASAMANW